MGSDVIFYLPSRKKTNPPKLEWLLEFLVDDFYVSVPFDHNIEDEKESIDFKKVKGSWQRQIEKLKEPFSKQNDAFIKFFYITKNARDKLFSECIIDFNTTSVKFPSLTIYNFKEPVILTDEINVGWNLCCPLCNTLLYDTKLENKLNFYRNPTIFPSFVKIKDGIVPDIEEEVNCYKCGKTFSAQEILIIVPRNLSKNRIPQPLPIFRTAIQIGGTGDNYIHEGYSPNLELKGKAWEKFISNFGMVNHTDRWYDGKKLMLKSF